MFSVVKTLPLANLNCDTFVPAKAYSPITATSLPNVTLLKAEQPLNALEEITAAFIVIEVRLVQPSNTFEPILILGASNVTVFKLILFENAPIPSD